MPTDFNEISYSDDDHTYYINGKQLLAVTSVVKHFAPEFDRDGISQRVAEREGVTQEEILRRWELAGELGRDRGTRLHQYVEDTMNGKVDKILRTVNERIKEMDAFDAAWKAMRADLNVRLVRQEWIIGDAELGIAGRLDCLLSIKIDGEEFLCVFDWKTGKLDVDNRFGFLSPPLQDFDSSKFNQYSVQLSLYRLILERNLTSVKRPFSDGYILHLRDDGSYHLHRAKDFREQLSAWLSNGPPADLGDAFAIRRLSHAIKVMSGINGRFVNEASLKSVVALEKEASRLVGLSNARIQRRV